MLFTVTFNVLEGAKGTTTIDFTFEELIDSEFKTSKDYTKTNGEVNFDALLSFVAERNGDVVTVKAILDRIPDDIKDLASIDIEYSFDKTMLEYVNTVVNLDGAIGTEGNFVWNGATPLTTLPEGGLLFTVTFNVLDGAKGTTDIKYTFVELLASDFNESEAFSKLDGNVQFAAVLEFVAQRNGNVVTVDAILDRIPDDIKDLASIDIEYSFDKTMLEYVNTVVNLDGAYGTEGNFVWNGATPLTELSDNGLLFTMTFNVLEGAHDTTYIVPKFTEFMDSDFATAKDYRTIPAKVDFDVLLSFDANYNEAQKTVTLDAYLSNIPFDLKDLASIDIEYSFDDKKLAYDKTDVNLDGAYGTKGNFVWNGKITELPENSLLFTVTFNVLDAATGEATFDFTFEELVDSLFKTSGRVKTKGDSVDLGDISKYTVNIYNGVVHEDNYVDKFENIEAGSLLDKTEVYKKLNPADYKLQGYTSSEKEIHYITPEYMFKNPAKGSFAWKGSLETLPADGVLFTMEFDVLKSDETQTVVDVVKSAIMDSLYNKSKSALGFETEVKTEEEKTVVVLKVVLSALPADISNIGIIEFEYTFDNTVLEYKEDSAVSAVGGNITAEDGIWEKFDFENTKINSDLDLCLLTRTISISVLNDGTFKGYSIPELIVEVPYDSETAVGESVLDVMTALRASLNNALTYLKNEKNVDLYEELVSKLKAKGFADANGNIVAKDITLKMSDFLSAKEIEGKIDEYIENGLKDDEFIATILSNDAIVNSLLNNEEIKINFMKNEELKNKLLGDENFIKEMASDETIINAIIESDKFKESFINNDATFEYIMNDDGLKKKILDDANFRKILIDECIKFVISAYFEAQDEAHSTSPELYHYIDTVLKSDEFIEEIESKPELKDLLEDEIKAIIKGGNDDVKAEIFSAIRNSYNLKKSIMDTIKNDDAIKEEIMNAIKNDSELKASIKTYVKDAIATDAELKDSIMATVKDALKTNTALKENVKTVVRDMITTDGEFRTYVKNVVKDMITTDTEVRDSAVKAVKEVISSDDTLKAEVKSVVKDMITNNDDVKDEAIKAVKEAIETDSTLKDKVVDVVKGLVEDDNDVRDAAIKAVKDAIETDDTLKANVQAVVKDMITNDADVKDSVKVSIKNALDTDDELKANVTSVVSDMITNDTAVKNSAMTAVQNAIATDDTIKSEIISTLKVADKKEIEDEVESWILDNITDSDVNEKVVAYVKADDAILAQALKAKDPTLYQKYEEGYIDLNDPDVQAAIDEYLADSDNLKELVDDNFIKIYEDNYEKLCEEMFDLFYTDADIFAVAFDEFIADPDNVETAVDKFIENDANFDTVFEDLVNNDEIFNTAFNEVINDTENFNKAFDKFTADPDNLETAVEKFIEDDTNFANAFDDVIANDEVFNTAFETFVDNDEIFNTAFDDVINNEDIFNSAFDKVIADDEIFDVAFDKFVSNPDNFESAFDKFIADPDNFDTAFEQVISDNDSFKAAFDKYIANEDNFKAAFDKFIEDDDNLNTAFTKFVSNEAAFNDFYNTYVGDTDRFNELFEKYYTTHVHDVALAAYKNEELNDMVMDYIRTYTEELAIEYAEDKLEDNGHGELKETIDKLMHDEMPSAIRDAYKNNPEIKTMIDGLIEENAKELIDAYVNDELTADEKKIINDAINDYADTIVDAYINKTLDDYTKGFVDDAIENYVKSIIDGFVNGENRDQVRDIIVEYAEDAVNAYKQTDAYKNLIAGFANGDENIVVNKDNLLLVRGIATAVDGYTFEQIKNDFIDPKFHKLLDLIGDDVINRYVEEATSGFVTGLTKACDEVEADVANGVENPVRTYPASLGVDIDIIGEILYPAYNKAMSKLKAKIESTPAIKYGDNEKLQQLVNTNLLDELFFDKTVGADGKAVYSIKKNLIGIYDRALELTVLAHDALIWYNGLDDSELDSMISGAATILAGYADKLNTMVMNYITNGELPGGMTLEQILDFNGKIEEYYNKYESYIEKALEKYEQYMDRDYEAVFDKLATGTVVANGEEFRIVDVAIENKVFDIDDVYDAIFSGNNFADSDKAQRVIRKLKSAEYVPPVNASRYYVDAYKATLDNKEFKGYSTGNTTVNVKRYLQ